MPDISKIRLPDFESIYSIKDSESRAQLLNKIEKVVGAEENTVPQFDSEGGLTVGYSIEEVTTIDVEEVTTIDVEEVTSIDISQSISAASTNEEIPTSLAVKTYADTKIAEPASEGSYGQVLATDGDNNRFWTTVATQAGVQDVLVNNSSVVTDSVAKVTVPTKTSDITNDSGFITNAAIAGKADTTYVDQQLLTKENVINDLSAIRSGAALGATAYQKPSTGIPKIDLTATVQSSLGKADTALQEHQDISGKAEQVDVDVIESKIPTQATSTNQLADKAFVNSSVQTATSNFRGNWSTWASVPTDSSLYPLDYAGVRVPSTNDYMVVADSSDYSGTALEGTWRFKYGGVWSTDGKSGWNPEYQVNETPMTAAQLAAINSGITEELVGNINNIWYPTVDNQSNISWARSSTSAAPATKNIKGETGDSGVYIGTVEPTDPEVKVWIDPSGGQRFPDPPSTNGVFVLSVDTTNGGAVYSWIEVVNTITASRDEDMLES